MLHLGEKFTFVKGSGRKVRGTVHVASGMVYPYMLYSDIVLKRGVLK